VNWVAELNAKGMSPSRVSQALLSLKQIPDLAVLDGRLARNVAKPVKLPRPRKAEPRFLTHDQVEALAEACGDHGDQYRLFVLVAGLQPCRALPRSLAVHSARPPTHHGEPGGERGSERESRAAASRPCVGSDDARHLRVPLRRRPRRVAMIGSTAGMGCSLEGARDGRNPDCDIQS
jgi:integrase